ncbi:MAG TPA: hypothetical protein PLA87_16980 [Pseudomonadota bacterium]|mgnify:CR=1 FL=1|jgi:hypothetical protein|nr:hypothetical protein [Pseudomonadota bacterium]
MSLRLHLEIDEVLIPAGLPAGAQLQEELRSALTVLLQDPLLLAQLQATAGASAVQLDGGRLQGQYASKSSCSLGQELAQAVARSLLGMKSDAAIGGVGNTTSGALPNVASKEQK